MADEANVGGAKITISADSGPAEKAVASFFGWFERTGEKATELAGKISGTIEKTKELGDKGVSSIKTVTTGFQSMTKQIESANSSISADSKKNFDQMKKDAKLSYSEMTKDSKAMNRALVISMQDSVSTLKSSFTDLKNGFMTVGTAILDMFKQPVKAIKSVPSTVQTAMKSVSGFVASGFAQAKNQAISHLQQIPIKATQAINRTKDVFVTGFNSVVNTAANAVSKVGNSLSQLPSKASQVASDLKSRFVSGIKDIPNRASNTWNSLKKGIQNIPQSALSAASSIRSSLASGFQSILDKARSIFPGVRQQIKSGVEDPSRNAKDAIGEIASSIGSIAIVAKGFSFLKNSVGKAIERIDTIDTATKSLTVLTGDASIAKKVMDDLSEAIEGTPIALNEVALGAKKMVAAGMEGTKVKGVFKSIADAAYGVGQGAESIDPMITAFSRMQTASKLSLDPIRSLEDVGVPALKILANQYNMSSDDMQKSISDGSINSLEAIDKLTEGMQKGTSGIAGETSKMEGLAQSAADTISGSLANFRTSITSTMTEVLSPFKNVMIDTFKSATESVKNFRDTVIKSEGFQEKLTKIENALRYLLESASPLVSVIKGLFASFSTYGVLIIVISLFIRLKQALTSFIPLLLGTNPVIIFAAAIVGLIVVLKDLYNRFEPFKKLIDGLRESFKQGLNGRYFSSDMNILEKGMYKLGETMKKLKLVAENLFSIFSGKSDYFQLSQLRDTGALADSTVDGLAKILYFINQVKAGFQAFFSVILGESSSLDEVNNKFKSFISEDKLSLIYKLAEAVKTAFESIKEQFNQFKEALSSAFQGDFGPLLGFVQQLLPKIIAILIGGIPGLIITGSRLISKLAEGMGTTVPELLDTAGQIIVNFVTSILEQAPAFLQTGMQILANIIGGIVTVFGPLVQTALQIGLKIIQAIIQVLPQLLQAGVKILSSIIEGIIQFLPQLIEAVLLLINSIVGFIVMNLPIIIDAGIKILMALIEGIVAVLPTLIEAAINLILSIVNALIASLPTIIQAGVKILSALIEGILSILPQLIVTALKLIIAIAAAIIQNLPQILKAGVEILLAIGKGIISAIGQLLAMLPEVFNSIKDAFLEVDWKKLGKDVLDGIIKGFKAGIKGAKDTVVGFAGDIAGWFKGKLEIASPSKVMVKLAKWVPEGVAVGIEKSIPVVDKAVSLMADTMTNAVQDAEPSGLTSNMILTESYGMPNATDMQASAVQASQAGNQGMADATPQLLQTALNAATGIVNQFTSIDPQMITEGSRWVLNFLSGWNATFPTYFNQVRNHCNQVITLLRSFYNAMNQTGRTWLQNLLNGWNSLYQAFVNRVSQLGNDAINNLRSKSGGFHSAGAFLMQSLINGINSLSGSLDATMRGIANKMVGGIGKGVNGVISGVNYVLKEVESDKKIGDWGVPQYAQGTDGHPADGPALVNDQQGSKYRELIQNPDGSVFMPKARNALVWLKKGTKVLNANMTDRVLKAQQTLTNFSSIPRYEEGVGDFDFTELLDGPDALVKLINERTSFDGVNEPWLNMSKSAVKLMTSKAYDMVKRELDKFYTHGSFDGAMNANNVYQYLVDVAQRVMAKFPGLTVTSGYRPGDPYYHGKHQALDIAFPGVVGSSKYTEAANYAFEKFPRQIAYVITNGMVRDRMGLSGTGSSGQWVRWPDNDHFDHIHLNGSMGSGDIFTASDSGSAAGYNPSAGVEQWRSLAIKALKMEGQYTQANLNAMLRQIQTESGGNPNAINNWDINAQRGDPSRGLLQTISTTFRAYARPGYDKNIVDPLSNMLASIRYAVSRYGSLTAAYRGVGYENGGIITKDGLYRAGEGNKPEMIIPLTKPRRALELITQALGYVSMNGFDLIESASIGLNNLASNMTLNLMDMVGYNTQAIRGSLSSQDALDFRAIITLLDENNELLRQNNDKLDEIRDQESIVMLDKRPVGKALASENDKNQAERNKWAERGLKL